MKILVTGTSGFIGYQLSRKLLSLGHEVVGFDNINDYYDVTLKEARMAQQGISGTVGYGERTTSGIYPQFTFYKGDLSDKELLNIIFASEKPEYVCNLAAQAGVRYSLTHPDVYIKSNIEGFLNILEACRHHKVKHLVYASSSSVYGLDKNIPFCENQHTDHPVSLYAASKKSNEMMAHSYSHLFNLPTTGLRFFTVYGPWGRPDMALFIFTKAILEGKPIEVFNYGNMKRDFTYVDDIVEGISKVIPAVPQGQEDFDPMHPDPSFSSAPFRIFNIGNNKEVLLSEFITKLEDELGRKAEKIMKPLQAGDVPGTYASCDYLHEVVGYKPSTSVETGIRNFVKWYRDFYKV